MEKGESGIGRFMFHKSHLTRKKNVFYLHLQENQSCLEIFMLGCHKLWERSGRCEHCVSLRSARVKR